MAGAMGDLFWRPLLSAGPHCPPAASKTDSTRLINQVTGSAFPLIENLPDFNVL